MHWLRVSLNFSLFVEAEDDRQEYGEVRLRALGHVGRGVLSRRLHMAWGSTAGSSAHGR